MPKKEKGYWMDTQANDEGGKTSSIGWIVGGLIVVTLVVIAYFVFVANDKHDAVPAATKASLTQSHLQTQTLA